VHEWRCMAVRLVSVYQKNIAQLLQRQPVQNGFLIWTLPHGHVRQDDSWPAAGDADSGAGDALEWYSEVSSIPIFLVLSALPLIELSISPTMKGITKAFARYVPPPTLSRTCVIGCGTGGADVVCNVAIGRRISLRPGLGWQRVSCPVYGLGDVADRCLAETTDPEFDD
jgi:hypothetical protein